MTTYQKNNQTGWSGFRLLRTFVIGGVILSGVSSCGSERREDLQESGKVTVSDSTTNANPGGAGVGNAGKGYVQEGPQSVGAGAEDHPQNTENNNFKPEENILRDDSVKRKK
jgi:hypothetical protein